jgi:hypothetical protein
VEQMKGSTVDAMSKAVEDAAVVLIGVSRAYKESTNCRLEAQYAMQREVETVPLMLVEGYQADGWLGMLIGTRMWYGFYGASASDAGLFEGKVEELCRELGERGRTAPISGSVGGEPAAHPAPEPPLPVEPPPDAAGPIGAAPPSGKLAALLTDAQLERHAALLAAEGYAGVADLADAEDEDLTALGLKKPEVKRLRKALDQWMCD